MNDAQLPHPYIMYNGSNGANTTKYQLPSNCPVSSIPCRRTKRHVAEDQKDERYWEKRKRNNEAARKSRENKRKQDLTMRDRVQILEHENSLLRREIAILKTKYGVPVDQSVPSDPVHSPSNISIKSENQSPEITHEHTEQEVVTECSLPPRKSLLTRALNSEPEARETDKHAHISSKEEGFTRHPSTPYLWYSSGKGHGPFYSPLSAGHNEAGVLLKRSYHMSSQAVYPALITYDPQRRETTELHEDFTLGQPSSGEFRSNKKNVEVGLYYKRKGTVPSKNSSDDESCRSNFSSPAQEVSCSESESEVNRDINQPHPKPCPVIVRAHAQWEDEMSSSDSSWSVENGRKTPLQDEELRARLKYLSAELEIMKQYVCKNDPTEKAMFRRKGNGEYLNSII
ncbi:uncharacterized protein LOC106170640 [Lingula anatina]|uniref:Uncharacterized protein LOC106170640 n=1 Tax=Lingula anatina TaxID=7574 RepID=A0A1S3J744_LINAN|nr:uncharacterized protein LOC106170640 [Lingula anatina]|eukprot:XP_013406066.1 uncharacterized protein LOC106170640 [Lingula anatina]